MGMQVGTEEEDEVLSAINTTPLVDVMLVLLIIFLITIPVATKTIALDLPKERNQPRVTKPENINIAVTQNGEVFWNEGRIGHDVLLDELKRAAVQDPQPEIQIRGDAKTAYEHVGRVILTAQRAGIAKVGFITEPPPK
jgi:biopolymer transport protein ExbD